MLLSSIFSLLGSVLVSIIEISELMEQGGEAESISNSVFLEFLLQSAFGVLGIVSGMNFLRLKSWARRVLEILTLGMLVLAVGFAVFLVVHLIRSNAWPGDAGFGILGITMSVLATSTIGVPLFIMYLHLKGDKLKSAFCDA